MDRGRVTGSDTDDRMMVFAGNANLPLAQQIANHLRLPLGKAVAGRLSIDDIRAGVLPEGKAEIVKALQAE